MTFRFRFRSRKYFVTYFFCCLLDRPLGWPRLPFCTPPEDRLRLLDAHGLWKVVLAALAVPLGFIAFWPSPVDQPMTGQLSVILGFLHRQGIPGWVNYGFVEASGNVVLFMPFGFVGAFAFPRTRWWHIDAFGFLVSGSIELGQFLFLHARSASLWDIVANSCGAVFGALLAALSKKGRRPGVFSRRASQSDG